MITGALLRLRTGLFYHWRKGFRTCADGVRFFLMHLRDFLLLLWYLSKG